MEQPLHTLAATHTSPFSPSRIVALSASTLLVLGCAWALSAGLAQTLVEKVNDVLKAEVIPEKLPDKTPPPPPPDLKAPPPPYVPPPDIVIQMDTSAPTAAITTQSKVQTAPAISSPASVGRPHTCLQDYPPISKRLGETGTTVLSFRIGTDGNVREVGVATSRGSQGLDDAAVSCASSWRYKAAIQSGVPVEVPWKAQVQWVLH